MHLYLSKIELRNGDENDYEIIRNILTWYLTVTIMGVTHPINERRMSMGSMKTGDSFSLHGDSFNSGSNSSLNSLASKRI